MLKELKQISSRLFAENPYWKYNVDIYNMPTGNQREYHYVDSVGSVFIIPYYDGKFTLVNQFRYLNQKPSLEFPGGGLKSGHNAYNTAKLELKEEAGLIANKLHLIGKHNPYNGVTNEICYVYFADDIIPDSQEPDESEEIEIFRLTPDEVKKSIADNSIWDGMTLAAWSLFIYSKFYES